MQLPICFTPRIPLFFSRKPFIPVRPNTTIFSRTYIALAFLSAVEGQPFAPLLFEILSRLWLVRPSILAALERYSGARLPKIRRHVVSLFAAEKLKYTDGRQSRLGLKLYADIANSPCPVRLASAGTPYKGAFFARKLRAVQFLFSASLLCPCRLKGHATAPKAIRPYTFFALTARPTLILNTTLRTETFDTQIIQRTPAYTPTPYSLTHRLYNNRTTYIPPRIL